MDIDITILFQLGLYLLLVVIVNGIFLKPFQRILQEREARITGARRESRRLKRIGDSKMEQYQARMREARLAAQQARAALRDAGRTEERRLLAEVRAEIATSLNASRQQVAEAEAQARSCLTTETDALARRMVERILRREVSA